MVAIYWTLSGIKTGGTEVLSALYRHTSIQQNRTPSVKYGYTMNLLVFQTSFLQILTVVYICEHDSRKIIFEVVV